MNIIGQATLQLILLGALGFFLVKRNFLPSVALQALSKLLIDLMFPFFIFHELLNNFSFKQFPNWWVYPFLSFILIFAAFILAQLFSPRYKTIEERKEFLAAVTFSNAGYLPLVLIAALFDSSKAGNLYILLFLFLLGFNLVIWSFGVFLLAGKNDKGSTLAKLFNPPVIAIVLGLLCVFFKANLFIPKALDRSIGLLGNCTLPLVMLVTGGNLAEIKIENILLNKELQLIVFLKLMLLPFLVFAALLFFKIDPLLKFLLILQAGMPTAVSLSVICRSFNLKGELSNQAIFWTHICSMVTLPLFLFVFRVVAELA